MPQFSFERGFVAERAVRAGLRVDGVGLTLCLGLLVVICLVSPACAAEDHAKGSEAILLTQILLLICFGGLLGELMLLVGQPAVMGQLLAGRR